MNSYRYQALKMILQTRYPQLSPRSWRRALYAGRQAYLVRPTIHQALLAAAATIKK